MSRQDPHATPNVDEQLPSEYGLGVESTDVVYDEAALLSVAS